MVKARSTSFGPFFLTAGCRPEATDVRMCNAFSGGLQGRNDGFCTSERGSLQTLWGGFLCLSKLLAGAGVLRRDMPKDLPGSVSQGGTEEISADGEGPGDPPAG